MANDYVENIYTLNVDLKRKHTAIVPTFVQYDKATLIFRIFDNGKEYDLSNIESAQVTTLRADGQVVIGVATIETVDGKQQVRYEYMGNEMNVEGFSDTSLTLQGSEGEKISIRPFKVYIVADIRDALGATEEYGLLQELLVEINETLDNMRESESTREEQEEQRQENEQDRKESEEARELAEQDRAGAEGERVTAEDKRDGAEETRKTNESDRISAESNRETAESTRVTNENARESNEADRKQEESERVINENAREQDEADRTEAETDRKSNEEARISSEETRVQSESARVENEDERVLAENIRVQQELGRQTDTQEAINDAEEATSAINDVLPNVINLENAESYNSEKTYRKNNIVEFNGSSYMALQDTKGNHPPILPNKVNNHWALLAQRGVDGDGAVASVNGLLPDSEGNIELYDMVRFDDLYDVLGDIDGGLFDEPDTDGLNIDGGAF